MKTIDIRDESDQQSQFSTINQRQNMTPSNKNRTQSKTLNINSSEKKDNLIQAKQKIFDKIDELEKLINQKSIS